MPTTTPNPNGSAEESRETSDEGSSSPSSTSSDESSDSTYKPSTSSATISTRSSATLTRTITPASAASVPIPPKILSGWTHRGAPSPRRVAKGTNLGAIDENTDAVSPDIPVRAHHRPTRTINFGGFIPTLHSSRDPPAYSKYDDLIGPNGEKFADLRRNRSERSRGGWFRYICYILILLVLVTALAVGLGVGLTRHVSKPSTSGPSGSKNNTQAQFPEGSYSFTTFLDTVSTSCTPNPSTWRCYPYQTYDESTTGSQTVFNWVISPNTDHDDSSSKFTISSSNNPFALTFSNANLSLINPNTSNEAYSFSVPMRKIVIPSAALTSDDATTQCFYNNTMFQATLYTKKVKTYPAGPTTSGSTSNANFGQWPHAVQIEEIIQEGSGVPDCYKMVNGMIGPQVNIGEVQGNRNFCSCLYQNFGT